MRALIGSAAGLIFIVSTALTAGLAITVRLCWRRGKELEEP